MITKKKTEHRSRLKVHIRKRVIGTKERPRLAVFKSLKHVYAQIVDDSTGTTILSVSDISKGSTGVEQEGGSVGRKEGTGEKYYPGGV
ncbi:MAG: ribosomal protein [Bacteroidetes bacterium]|nr:ribosomal protein [Bacteroidota bacterium]